MSTDVPDNGQPLPIRCHVVERMPADLVVLASPRRDPECVAQTCDHQHEVAVRVADERRDQLATGGILHFDLSHLSFSDPAPLFVPPKVSDEEVERIRAGLLEVMGWPGRITVLPPNVDEVVQELRRACADADPVPPLVLAVARAAVLCPPTRPEEDLDGDR